MQLSRYLKNQNSKNRIERVSGRKRWWGTKQKIGSLILQFLTIRDPVHSVKLEVKRPQQNNLIMIPQHITDYMGRKLDIRVENARR